MGFLDSDGLAHLWEKVKTCVEQSEFPLPVVRNTTFSSVADLEAAGVTMRSVVYMDNCAFKGADSEMALATGSDFCIITPLRSGQLPGAASGSTLRVSFGIGLGSLSIPFSNSGDARPFLSVTYNPLSAKDVYFYDQTVSDSIESLNVMVLPPGGSAGQVLAKLTDAAYDVRWTDGATMEQVNAAISSAITGAIEEVYYGTGKGPQTAV